MNKGQILQRYAEVKKYESSNCRGTAFYLVGLIDEDKSIGFIREPIISQASDLRDSEEIVDGGLIMIFGGSYDRSGKFLREGVAHAGVSLNIDGEWRVLHRFGCCGEVFNESLKGQPKFSNYIQEFRSSYYPKESLFKRFTISPVYFFEVLSEYSKEKGIVNLLKRDKPKIKLLNKP